MLAKIIFFAMIPHVECPLVLPDNPHYTLVHSYRPHPIRQLQRRVHRKVHRVQKIKLNHRHFTFL